MESTPNSSTEGYRPSRTRERSIGGEAGIPLRLIAWAFVAMALDIGVARITYGTVLPALRRDLDLSFVAGGVLSAVNLAAYLLGTLVAPLLSRYASMPALARWGHAVFAAGALASGLAHDPALLGLGRTLMGLGAGVGLLALFVVVFEQTRPDLRSLVSTAVWSGIGLAIVISGFCAPLLIEAAGNWRWAFLVAALLAIGVSVEVGRSGGVAGPGQAVSSGPSQPGESPGMLPWLGLFGAYFMFGVGYIAYSTFVGGRLAAMGAPTETVVWSWVNLGLGSLLGSALGAAILWSPAWKPVALVVASLAGASGAAVATLPGGFGPLAGALLVGLGLASTPAIVTAFVRERTRDAQYARLFSWATASLGVGQLIGPVAAGALADHLGPGSVLAFASAAYLIGALFATGDLLRARL